MSFHSNSKKTVKVCQGRACKGAFSDYTAERAEKEIAAKKSSSFAEAFPFAKAPENRSEDEAEISLERCSCQGRCEQAPTMVVEWDDQKIVHTHVDPIKAAKIISTL